ncbi:MAG: hypothetical protein E6I29_08795 [Chloroflexi bacterium]|nr:MAG: hypothetical protein E6I29_08795 [Chloroflexota bacterium]
MVTAFASMMRHETRTALVGIQGLSELIRDGGLSADEIKTCADEIFGAAQKIDALIGQMFDLNRLETGQTSFRRTRIDVNSLVSEVVLRTRAGTRQLSIGLEHQAGGPTRGGQHRLQHPEDRPVRRLALWSVRPLRTATQRHRWRGPGPGDRASDHRDAQRAHRHHHHTPGGI